MNIDSGIGIGNPGIMGHDIGHIGPGRPGPSNEDRAGELHGFCKRQVWSRNGFAVELIISEIVLDILGLSAAGWISGQWQRRG